MKKGNGTSRGRIYNTILALIISVSLIAVPVAAGAVEVFADASGSSSSYVYGQSDSTAGETFLPEETDKISRSMSIADSDELLEDYVENEVAEGVDSQDAAVTNRNTRGSKLTGNNKIVYNEMRKQIEKIASGEVSSSVITISLSKYIGQGPIYKATDYGYKSFIKNGAIVPKASELMKAAFPYDNEKIINALLTDLPYDFYWFDKTIAYSYGLNVVSNGSYVYFRDRDPVLTFRLSVSRDYSRTGGIGTQETDADLCGSAAAAAGKAADIINACETLDDIEKLTAYKDIICALTRYNNKISANTPYGDPWQLIYVFDGDPDTNVVCEGYAKAFQFLCDMSSFNSSLTESRLVTGTLSSLGSDELHMWNIVRLPDGKCYLADVTNSDTGTIGSPYKLFLVTAVTGSVSGGYTYKINLDSGARIVRYTYDSDTKSTFSTSELALNSIAINVTEIGNKTYTGKSVTQNPVVVQEGNTLKEGTDYTVRYSNNKNVGTAKVTITGAGLYQGYSRTISFKILPKGRSVSGVTGARKAFTVRWSRLATKMSKSRITGYQIQYSTDKKFKTGAKTVTVKGYNKKSRRISKLRAKKTYYVRIRTYMKVSGTNYYSSWSKVKSVRTK